MERSDRFEKLVRSKHLDERGVAMHSEACPECYLLTQLDAARAFIECPHDGALVRPPDAEGKSISELADDAIAEWETRLTEMRDSIVSQGTRLNLLNKEVHSLVGRHEMLTRNVTDKPWLPNTDALGERLEKVEDRLEALEENPLDDPETVMNTLKLLRAKVAAFEEIQNKFDALEARVVTDLKNPTRFDPEGGLTPEAAPLVARYDALNEALEAVDVDLQKQGRDIARQGAQIRDLTGEIEKIKQDTPGIEVVNQLAAQVSTILEGKKAKGADQ